MSTIEPELKLGKAKDRIEMLRELNADPKCPPLFWMQLASELMVDAREKENVDYLIRRSLKYQSDMSTPYSMLGSIKFEERKEAEAVEAFRLARMRGWPRITFTLVESRTIRRKRCLFYRTG